MEVEGRENEIEARFTPEDVAIEGAQDLGVRIGALMSGDGTAKIRIDNLLGGQI